MSADATLRSVAEVMSLEGNVRPPSVASPAVLHDPRPSGTPVGHVTDERPDGLVISFKRGPPVGSTSDQLFVVRRLTGSRVVGCRWDRWRISRDVGKRVPAASPLLEEIKLHIFDGFPYLGYVRQLGWEGYVFTIVVFVPIFELPDFHEFA